VITQALRASASLIGASAPAISETPPKCRNQPNRGFADYLILNADHLLDVFGSLLMLALSKENWDPPFTGIWSIPHFPLFGVS
jgi:hypothetical protein